MNDLIKNILLLEKLTSKKIILEDISDEDIDSVFSPQRLDAREEKRINNLKKLLQQEVVEGNLNLRDEKWVSNLGRVKEIKGYLNLENTNITSLPERLIVDSWLNLINTPIISLPKGLTVGESLSIRNTKITSLPEGLSVGNNFYLKNTNITSLPKGLIVNGWLDLENTPLSKNKELMQQYKKQGFNLFY